MLIKLLTSNFSGSILNFTFKQVTEGGKHASLIKGIKNIHPLKWFLQALNKSQPPHKVSFSSFSPHNLSVSTLMRKRCLIERWKNMRASGRGGWLPGGPLKRQVSLPRGKYKALALSLWASSHSSTPLGSRGGCDFDLDLSRAPGPYADCLGLCQVPTQNLGRVVEAFFSQIPSPQGQRRVSLLA